MTERTAGTLDTAETARSTSGVRIGAGHVAPVQDDGLASVGGPAEGDRRPFGKVLEGLLVVEGDPGLKGLQCDAAVHGPGVEVGESVLARYGPGYGGFTRAGRPVDGDDHRWGRPFVTNGMRGV